MQFSTQVSGPKKCSRRERRAMVCRSKPTNATTSSKQRFEAWTLENWRPNYADPPLRRPPGRRSLSMAGTTGLFSARDLTRFLCSLTVKSHPRSSGGFLLDRCFRVSTHFRNADSYRAQRTADGAFLTGGGKPPTGRRNAERLRSGVV